MSKQFTITIDVDFIGSSIPLTNKEIEREVLDQLNEKEDGRRLLLSEIIRDTMERIATLGVRRIAQASIYTDFKVKVEDTTMPTEMR